ncbi:transcription initiation factor TFIID subunit 11-like [Quillaja saponaria]|uniref:Transcription initiation factor TFIID subunit 11-like n=1 Tax=Quillaja saponaria TaxID=32244 RepID=A0AAD7LL19_QUISA|nr:transcription initiation factor TFIID subunit 11-like [Quillaja saponaria]
MDPFEAEFEDYDELPPSPPVGPSNGETQTHIPTFAYPLTSPVSSVSTQSNVHAGNNQEQEEEAAAEEEEAQDENLEIGDIPHIGNSDKLSKTRSALSQFTDEQLNRYECFRRSRFKRAEMERLLARITGFRRISVPMTVAVSATAKLFVGELIEFVMTERNEFGPVRPSHIREAYRRLKLEGKVPRRSPLRLF